MIFFFTTKPKINNLILGSAKYYSKEKKYKTHIKNIKSGNEKNFSDIKKTLQNIKSNVSLMR